MKLALIQMPVVESKQANLKYALRKIEKASELGARLIVLPEMFVCPYATRFFAENAEDFGGESQALMSDAAKKHGVTLVAGTIPERCEGKLYNTSFVYGPDGRQIARHRKVHLFDIDIAGGPHYKESATFAAGSDVTVFDVDSYRVGLCICFDIRFPELLRMTTLAGAELIVLPAAFSKATGTMHWDLALRSKAVDNQLFIAGCSPARRKPYEVYAHSLVADPWGKVIARAGTRPEMLICDLDMDEPGRVRAQLPLLSARRTDLY
ncbi:MAG TPA: carbon-nitrogen hydrolase family protein [Bacillota bacterium]|nr:carbon-nitrogen hydrolase family protein [Bacillota bacterium]